MHLRKTVLNRPLASHSSGCHTAQPARASDTPPPADVHSMETSHGDVRHVHLCVQGLRGALPAGRWRSNLGFGAPTERLHSWEGANSHQRRPLAKKCHARTLLVLPHIDRGAPGGHGYARGRPACGHLHTYKATARRRPRECRTRIMECERWHVRTREASPYLDSAVHRRLVEAANLAKQPATERTAKASATGRPRSGRCRHQCPEYFVVTC